MAEAQEGRPPLVSVKVEPKTDPTLQFGMYSPKGGGVELHANIRGEGRKFIGLTWFRGLKEAAEPSTEPTQAEEALRQLAATEPAQLALTSSGGSVDGAGILSNAGVPVSADRPDAGVVVPRATDNNVIEGTFRDITDDSEVAEPAIMPRLTDADRSSAKPNTSGEQNAQARRGESRETSRPTPLLILEQRRAEAGLLAMNILLDPLYQKMVEQALLALKNTGKTNEDPELQKDAQETALEQFKEAEPDQYKAYMDYGVHLTEDGSIDPKQDLLMQQADRDLQGELTKVHGELPAETTTDQALDVPLLEASNRFWDGFVGEHAEKAALYAPKHPGISAALSRRQPPEDHPQPAGNETATAEATADTGQPESPQMDELLARLDAQDELIAKLTEQNQALGEAMQKMVEALDPQKANKLLQAVLAILVVAGLATATSAVTGAKQGMAEPAQARG
ncbi:hypothetical protein A2690_00710 [Candidatus Roizmanbacteria bacterium RIFCSPHIGHO2_01_FULL_39_12b]|uniref:Uncharacterized protein n=1 Tax=Candidatus Roizmanbacteria bacterium RIFCSPHIGHO2_01_FULL_39_12b TaxID=1802030 RepID=A0A1F7GAN7_9BACT|nr:MAG: hypothetical protein A2690_00710 [Candidatus Roizmanbacteria bacterium RIFCSPHIGHO2_01_FULL_39_12b]